MVKLELAHEKSHSQSASIRKASSDKTREDRRAAREYRKQFMERRRSWIQPFLEVAKGNPEKFTKKICETPLEQPKPVGEREFLTSKKNIFDIPLRDVATLVTIVYHHP